MKQGHERAAAREPDGRLPGGVPSTDDSDPGGAAQLRLGRAGGVEDTHTLEVGQIVNREPPILSPRREHHRTGRDLVTFLQPNDVASVARLERDRAIGSSRTGAELARLIDRTA